MTEDVNCDRCRFIGIANLSIAAAELAMTPSAAQSKESNPAIINASTSESFGSVKQIDAGLLNIRYAESRSGQRLLRHG